MYHVPKANSAFHPSRVGKWVPALAGKAKTGMVHSVSGWMLGVQVKLWDPLRMRAIPERLKGVFTTRRYTNPRLPLPTLPQNIGPPTQILIDFQNSSPLQMLPNFQQNTYIPTHGDNFAKSNSFFFNSFTTAKTVKFPTKHTLNNGAALPREYKSSNLLHSTTVYIWAKFLTV